jgi:hypothetical protein
MNDLPFDVKEDFATAAQPPKKYGDYMSFDEGQNTFRILCQRDDILFGYEYWKEIVDSQTQEIFKKPVRIPRNVFEELQKTGKTSNKKYDASEILAVSSEESHFFWFFPVFNYKAGKVQLLSLRQPGLMKKIYSVVNNPKYSDVTKYDITVTKTGQGKESRYELFKEDSEPMTDHVKHAWEQVSPFLHTEAIFDFLGDPFKEFYEKNPK